MAVEGVGLGLLLAFALRPYLHLQLCLADGWHDIDIVLGIHLLTVVLDAVINLLPLKPTDVGPRVQLIQVDSPLQSEVVSPCRRSSNQQQAEGR